MEGHKKLRIKIPRSLVVTKMPRNFHLLVKDKDKASARVLGKAFGDEPVEALKETDRAGEGKQNRKDRQRVKMNLPLLSFLDKKKGWNNFMRQVRRKVSLRHLVRIPSKILVIRLKLKMTRSLIKKKATKQFEQGDDDEDEGKDRELWKKRILMGGRCRPLNSPGYDTSREQRHP